MATLDSIIDQIAKSDLDILGLLKLRTTIEDRLSARHRELRKQLAAVEGAMPGAGGDDEPKQTRRRGRSSAARKTPVRARKTRRRSRGAGGSGKHAGMSVSEAVVALLKSKGGKMSAAEIKKSFVSAGDRRNLNFTLLTRSGTVKRTGFEAKKEGKKGRVGGIYSLA